MEKKRGFASDNNAGVHPAVMNKLAMANKGHVLAYGEDELTELTKSLLSGIFGTLNIHFVFGGTAANVLSFASLMGSHEAVICADTAHINVDECGAPERFVGCKLLPIKTGNGKITTDQIKRLCNTVDIPHSVEPKMVSISQPTELGTVYSMKELACISNLVRSRGLFLHVDGARFANAAAYLKIKDLSKFMEHIDVLSFGGTKNGMMFGEAVIFHHRLTGASGRFSAIAKQGMQLPSKMRFIAAQFLGLFENDLWYENAKHANEMADILATVLRRMSEVKIVQRVQSNAVFVQMPPDVVIQLQECFPCYVWGNTDNVVRLMSSFDTSPEDIEELVDWLKQAIASVALC